MTLAAYSQELEIYVVGKDITGASGRLQACLLNQAGNGQRMAL